MNDKDIFRINLADMYNRNNFFTSLKNTDKLLIRENKSENTSLIRAQEEFYFDKSPRS
jgi:hypothetical protein